MSASYVMALDLGTTGNRALVFDRDQNVKASAYREFPQIFPQPGWVEHDPEAIWETTREVMQEVLQKVGVENVATIGITNQRETVVAWDRATGRPVYNAIVWQCRRTAEMCERLKSLDLQQTIRDKTGLVIDAYFSGTKIKWLLDNVPGLMDRAARGEIAAGTIDTWIIHKLTAGKSFITDPSNASRTMLYNLRDRAWDPALCNILGVRQNMLAEVVPSSGHLAVTDAGVVGREIPIGGIVGDQQGALFGQGCFAPGIVKNTYGTGLFFLMNTLEEIRTSSNLLTTVAWQIGDKMSYAVEGSVFIGGAAIQWLRDQLGLFENAAETDAMARAVASNDGVYFVPALVGLGAPLWDPHARGVLIGLTRGTGKNHIVRAALESIAYQTRDVLEAMRDEIGIHVSRLQVDGGAACNDFLMQFQADILGVPVERPRVLETTALGAAGLAGLSAGIWKSPEEFAALRTVDRVFEPAMDLPTRERLYSLWRKALERSLGWGAL